MGIRDNIRQEIARRYDGNASAFAKAASISAPYLNEILSGKRRFNEDFLKKVAQALNVPPYQLFADEPLVPYAQVRERHAAAHLTPDHYERIKLFEDPLSLGPGNEISEVPPSDYLPFLKKYLPRGYKSDPDRIIAFPTSGISMKPTINPGSIVWIEGKRVRRSLKTDEHGLALEKARDIKNDLLAKAHNKDITLHEFSLKYLNWAWDTKPASADQESKRMKKILEFFDSIDVRYLSDVTPYHVEQLRSWLKIMKVKKGDDVLEKTRSQATLNRYLQLLRGMFYKAIDWEVYKCQNPLKKVKFYREQRVIKPLSHDEAKAVLEACRKIGAKKGVSSLQKAFADLVEFAANTGMRKSEILNLQWKDIKNWEATVKGKGDRIRTVPLNAAARAIVERQRRQTPYVFNIENREQQDLFRRTVLQVRKLTGIPFHFHLCRHYFATTLLERGVDIVTISSILGHSKMMTSLLYSHTSKEKMKGAVELLLEGAKNDK